MEDKIKNRLARMGTTKVYGKGKNKKLMGVKAMSELKRSRTFMS
jgi:hypothetical protein